ncbi:AMMECR1-like protein [Asterias amurensis]|uniref:AMMECR1-like protein n=1 Tax=Asterias amurensis TaxID=7602 RepID=UPI003AB5CCC5
MATGCCGVKRQKVSAPSERNDRSERCEKGERCSHSSHEHRPSTSSGSNDLQRTLQPKMNGYSDRERGPHPASAGHSAGHHNNHRIVCAEMCFFCFDVLYRHFHMMNGEPPRVPKFTDAAFPLFVTWKIGKDKRLRGCIGTFTALNLHDGLREYAISSAFKDSRFPPVNKDEISRMSCSVSLLRHFEEAKDYEDWEVGIHGIRIEFYNEKGAKKTATYLPEVASEQNWNKEQTIDSLLRKGGYKTPINHDFRKTIRVTRYQSEKFSVSFGDYAEHFRQNGRV